MKSVVVNWIDGFTPERYHKDTSIVEILMTDDYNNSFTYKLTEEELLNLKTMLENKFLALGVFKWNLQQKSEPEKNSLNISYDEMKRLYIGNMLSIKEISKMLNVHFSVVSGHLKSYGLDSDARIRFHNSRAYNIGLPSSLTKADWDLIRSEFGNKCALTSESDIALDHFIPLKWGHGGTYLGNVIPLSSRLNNKKNAKNPFSWNILEDVDNSRWSHVIEWLAKLNGLTAKEFRQYVNWCDVNRRTVSEIKNEQKPSLEIWREYNKTESD